MMIQGRRASDGEYESILLSDDVLRSLLEAVYERRTA